MGLNIQCKKCKEIKPYRRPSDNKVRFDKDNICEECREDERAEYSKQNDKETRK